MLFNSIDFVVFFPIVVGLYFALPHHFRWMLLLASSYYFYMCWKPEYVILLLISTSIDYFAALKMGKAFNQTAKRRCLILSICSNLGILFAFKYFNLFNETARTILQSANIFYDIPAFDLLLPIGISFYTFQSLSYSIDVYRGNKQPERHFGIFALYVSFFPQLVSGPIERSTGLLPQLKKTKSYNHQDALDGMKLMLWGFFKKVVVADRLAVYVNAVYNNPGDYTGVPLILATYFFAFQVYCDFSGYSDIAIGAARIMGFKLSLNFNRPFSSKSISEFWKRWHITLSSWFKDYLYIPLGGNRVGKFRLYLNLLVVFLLCGFWHGANWTFLIWGGVQGFYLVFSNLTKPIREKLHEISGLTAHPRLHKYIKIAITFHLVLLSFIIFRAKSMGDAIYIFGQISNISIGSAMADIAAGFNQYSFGRGLFDFVIAVGAILIMEAVQFFQSNSGVVQNAWSQSRPLRWAAQYAILIAIIIFGAFNHTPFYYFQF